MLEQSPAAHPNRSLRYTFTAIAPARCRLWLCLSTWCLAALLICGDASAQYADSAETQYAGTTAGQIAYRILGNGSPIVLANRMRGTLDTWDPLFLDSLAKRHRVITFDYPGIGYSPGELPDDLGEVAKVILEFADALELENWAILGWSWGGLAAQALLLDHPQSITHAILIGTVPPGPGQVPVQQIFIDLALKPVNDLADEEVLFFEPTSEFSRAQARASHERIYARPGVVDRIPAQMEQLQVYFSAAGKFRDDQNGRREALIRSRVPILVISGDNDISVPVQNWFALVGQLASAQLLVYPRAGHGPQHQYPGLSADYISNFLEHTAR